MKYKIIFLLITVLSISYVVQNVQAQTIPEPVTESYLYLPFVSRNVMPTPVPTSTPTLTPTSVPTATSISTSTPVPRPTSTPSMLYSCQADIYNCSDFNTQREAQNVFDYCWPINGDIHRLDRDNNGVACETLP